MQEENPIEATRKVWQVLSLERARVTKLKNTYNRMRKNAEHQGFEYARNQIRNQRVSAQLIARSEKDIAKVKQTIANSPHLTPGERQALKGIITLHKKTIEQQQNLKQTSDEANERVQEFCMVRDDLAQANLKYDALLANLIERATAIAGLNQELREIRATFVRNYTALRIEYAAPNNFREYVIVTRSGKVEGPHSMRARKGTRSPD